jgi:hypothetical protein
MHLRHSFVAIVVFMIALLLIGAGAAVPQTHNSPDADLPINLEGRYSIDGINPNRGRYTGSLEVVAHGDVYEFRWNVGSKYDGIGVKNGKLVAVSFTNGGDGSGCGVINYIVRSDGTLDGVWGNWGTNASGTERARHVSGRGLEGRYAATGTNPSSTRYQVDISVRAKGSGYTFNWSNNSEGFGVRVGQNLAVGFGGTRCGFVAYEVKADGSLNGVWGGYGSELTGTEKATRQ